MNTNNFDTLFLDRDGVINKLRINDYVKKWEEFEFLPGVLDALRLLSKQFKRIIVVTNQRGVGKGMMTEDMLQNIHDKMIAAIENAGGRIDKVYYCTAISENDPDRKPNTGMALQAKKDFPDIDFSKSAVIGDSESDKIFAQKTGMKYYSSVYEFI
ncbi:MAG: HAD family hydrolase [Bacteroidales bacterium]|nr:HAD family hydrolase [Bacteroidales bacterium]